MIDLLVSFILGVVIALGLIILALMIANIRNYISYRKEHIWVRLDWFKMFRFFVYALILIFGGLYLLF